MTVLHPLPSRILFFRVANLLGLAVNGGRWDVGVPLEKHKEKGKEGL